MKHQLDWEAHFVHSDGSCVVDLHWGVSTFNIERCKDASFKIDLDHLWKESVPTRFLGTLVTQFSPEDLLMIRCQDAVKEFWKDGWPQLKWILDIGRIIDFYPQMDWESLFSNARKLGNLRLLHFCLSLSRQLIGMSIPSRLLNIIQKDLHAQSLTRKVIDRLSIKINVENKFLNPKWGFIKRGLFCISLKERIFDKVPYFNKILTAYIQRVHRFAKFRENKELLLLPNSLSFLYLLFILLHAISYPFFRAINLIRN